MQGQGVGGPFGTAGSRARLRLSRLRVPRPLGRSRLTATAADWTTADIPDLTGRTALVTGANSGIGKQAAMALAGAGATVLMGCRDPKKAAVALSDILDEHPDAEIEPLPLDLADLDVVAEAADHVLGRVRRARPADQQRRRHGAAADARPSRASRCSSGPTTSATSR